MAAITTAAAGNSSAGGTWVGGVVPGNGDTIIQNHALTIDANLTIGTSAAAGVDAITQATGAGVIMTVPTGVKVTCRGDARLKGPASASSAKYALVINGTGHFEFDSSLAAGSPKPRYTLFLGDTNQARVGVKMVGTSKTARAKLTANVAGGGNVFLIRRGTAGTSTSTGYFDATFAYIQYCGDGSNIGFDINLDNNGVARFWLNDVIIEDSSEFPFQSGTQGAAGQWRVKNTTWRDVVGGLAFQYNGGVSGGNYLKGCIIMDDCNLFQCTNLQVGGDGADEWVYFHKSPGVTLLSNAKIATPWRKCLIIATTCPIKGDLYDSYLLSIGDLNNPHFAALGDDLDLLIDGVVIEHDGTATNGDIFLLGNATTSKTIQLRRCIVLPNASTSGPSGTLTTDTLGDPQVKIDVEHCTYITHATAGVTFGESTPAPAGKVVSCRSNLVYRRSSSAGAILADVNAVDTLDALVAGMANHNGQFNLASGQYSGSFSVTPGANDVIGDPDLVDWDRDFAAFDTLHGGGSIANGLLEFQKKNDDSGYDAAYTVAALLTFIRDGFAPQSTLFQGAAHDGADIGAVPVLAAPPTLSTPVITSPTAGQIVDQNVTVQWTASS